jgi:hypothetical protein
MHFLQPVYGKFTRALLAHQIFLLLLRVVVQKYAKIQFKSIFLRFEDRYIKEIYIPYLFMSPITLNIKYCKVSIHVQDDRLLFSVYGAKKHFID